MKLQQLKTILYFIKGYERYIFGIFIFSFLFAFFEGLNIVVLFPLVNSIVAGDANLTGNSTIIKTLNMLIRIIPVKDMFIATCLFLIVVVILKNVFRYIYTVISAFAGYRIWDDIQKRLFLKYINADYRYFLNHKQGEIVYRLYSAPAFVGGILKLIPQLLTEALKIAIVGAILFSMSLPVTCGVAIIGTVFYFFTRGITNKVSYFLGKGRVEAGETQSVLINEMINGIKQIKVFLGEKRWVVSLNSAIDKYFKLSKKDTLWINMPVNALEIFALVSLSVFLIFVRKYSPESLVSNLPLLAVFAYAFQRVMPSLSLITTLKMQIMGGLPVLEMLHSAINEKMSCLTDGTRTMPSFNKSIKLDNVSFSYPGRSEALRNISIAFEKNKCTAIVGPSGSGKTTMINLIIRLFDPTEGVVLVDDIDLRDYKRNSWLSKIGFVSQDTFIFHATVRDNIVFGRSDAGTQTLVESAKIANAHDFIMALPDGYDTIVGEKGMKLSGGEQQRIAIARAILCNPEILIFDEATSSLDNISQSLIQNSIQRIARDHTVILIAHRLSTILNADKIVVLEKGEVKESGSHADLMGKKGHYYRLYDNETEFEAVK